MSRFVDKFNESYQESTLGKPSSLWTLFAWIVIMGLGAWYWTGFRDSAALLMYLVMCLLAIIADQLRQMHWLMYISAEKRQDDKTIALGFITNEVYHEQYGWWGTFLTARMQLIMSMVSLGKTDAEIMHAAGIVDQVQFQGLKDQAVKRLSGCK